MQGIRTVFVAIGVALALGLTSLAATAAGTPGLDRLRVQSIRLEAIDPSAPTRVYLELTRSAQGFKLFTLTHPDRVVLDVPVAALGPGALPLPGATGLVQGLRVAHRAGGSLRIVFDVSEAAKPVATPTRTGPSAGLIIDLLPASPRAESPVARVPAGSAASPSTRPVVAPLPAPSATQPSSAPPVAPPAAVAASPATAMPVPPASSPQRPEPARPAPRRLVTIAVDAGHGGHDPGARGPSGTREKDVTLAISRKLVSLINDEPGMRGVLTRRDDRFVVLRERMEKARSANADLFVSVHADAAYNRSARGSTVYVLNEKGATDEAARRLAARENAALIGGVELGNKDPVLASVLMDLSQNASISSSIAVGDQILGQLGRLGKLHRASVQQAPFMVLKSPDVPSVLVETAYISNPQDERNLKSSSHQLSIARAILVGIRQYFHENPPAPTLMASTEQGVRRVPSTGRDGPRPGRHRIQRGDTLSAIAARYRVSIVSLRAANGLRGDTVRIGQTLIIPQDS